MQTLNSFKGYGKVDPAEDLAFRRRTQKRVLLISASIIVLLFLVVSLSIALVLRHRSDADDRPNPSSSNLINSIKLICSLTLHPDTCVASLSSSNSSDPEGLFKLSIQVAISSLSSLSSLPDELAKRLDANETRLKQALEICSDQIGDSVDYLNTSLSFLVPKSPGEKILTESKVRNLRTYLSAVLAGIETCLDAFEGTTGDLKEKLEAALRNGTELTSNSLAIITHVFSLMEQLGIPIHRKLLASGPDWVEQRWRRVLLQDSTLAADVTVSPDGSADVKTITEALKRVPRKNAKPFVIRVLAGVYDELVFVEKYMWNVVMIGDGIGKSIITGSRNFAAGTQTFATASFVVEGKAFTAKGMTFRNTAGYRGQQAVAVRVKADQVVFFQCSFLAFQDTLYAHSFRQFYRDCEIAGTVDFIFGDASAVFQNCRLMPRQPGPGQQNMLTAQGRTDINENTGFSIQSCQVLPYDSVSVPTFLGRPWKPYSTVAYMTTEIDGVIDPRGWRSWDGVGDIPATTYYGEYMNTGDGAKTTGRVKWAGYKEAMTDAEAQAYSVTTFIQGDQWLTSTGVAYKLNV